MFRLQESGLGSQDILSEKPWKLKRKNMLDHFYIRGKRQHTFKAIWSRKNFHKFFFKFCSKLFRIIWNIIKTFKNFIFSLYKKKCGCEILVVRDSFRYLPPLSHNIVAYLIDCSFNPILFISDKASVSSESSKESLAFPASSISRRRGSLQVAGRENTAGQQQARSRSVETRVVEDAASRIPALGSPAASTSRARTRSSTSLEDAEPTVDTTGVLANISGVFFFFSDAFLLLARSLGRPSMNASPIPIEYNTYGITGVTIICDGT